MSKYFKIGGLLFLLTVIGGVFYFSGVLTPYSFREYKSERFGYVISYPRNWSVDDSYEKALLDIFHNANKNAVVFVQVSKNESYATIEGQKQNLAAIKKDLESRKEYRLASFTDEVRDGVQYFTAKGNFKDANGEWTFIQYGGFFNDGRAHNIVTRTLTGSVDTEGETLAKIAASFKFY